MPEPTTPAGATPAAADATSAQTTPAAPAADATAATATPPATDGTEALGDAGKRALDAMKAERDAAKREAAAAKKRADDLEESTRTESEKALTAAKKEGNLEATTKLSNSIRRSEVKAALTAAGVDSAFLDLAVKADEFAALEINDDGEVSGLDTALTAFKASHPSVFKAPATPPPAGSSDGGTRGATKVTKEQAIAWSKDPAMYEKHRDEILAAMAGT